MNIKLIVVAALTYFAVTMIVGFAITGPVIHEGLLDDDYQATETFWRPALRMDPPDIAAMMPRWMTTGVITAFITAILYLWLRPAFGADGWQSGAKFGLMLGIAGAMFMMGWSGIFNLPDTLWMWWAIDGLLLSLTGGAAIGWVVAKIS